MPGRRSTETNNERSLSDTGTGNRLVHTDILSSRRLGHRSRGLPQLVPCMSRNMASNYVTKGKDGSNLDQNPMHSPRAIR